MKPTPKSLGFSMPAEWSPMEAVWLTWPHNPDTWPGAFEQVEPPFAQMVAEFSTAARVELLVEPDVDIDAIRSMIDQRRGTAWNVNFRVMPTNDSWIRDYGPIFLTRPTSTGLIEGAVLDWRYNAWGGKYPPWDLDDRIAGKLAVALGLPNFEQDLILEGGSIDVNGAGWLLTTEQCLLNENRNPNYSRLEIEERLQENFGVNEVIWLGEGIVGDDTDGHVDDLTRFVGPRTVVTIVEDDPGEENYSLLRDNLDRLTKWRSRSGEKLEVVPLPTPRPVIVDDERLPASYANFTICNDKIVVPIFGDANDDMALDRLSHVLKPRTVVGVDARILVVGLGAVHCLTQQQPRFDRPAVLT